MVTLSPGNRRILLILILPPNVQMTVLPIVVCTLKSVPGIASTTLPSNSRRSSLTSAVVVDSYAWLPLLLFFAIVSFFVFGSTQSWGWVHHAVLAAAVGLSAKAGTASVHEEAC